MKTRIILLTSLALLLLTPAGSFAQRLQLDSLKRLESLASEKVNIDIDPGMLRLAAMFMKGQGDEAEMKKMLSELKGIYVRTFEFDNDVEAARDLEPIRKQLSAGSWVRLVGVDSKRDREFVEIYSWREGDASGGLAILMAGPNEVAVVNIVGPFDIARLGALRGLGIPNLPGNAGGR
jgi:ribulose bisphosphate carboxylase small subunit